ncbi:MAG: hypothetical protein A3G34_04710 [Candidatus Lindowbacteria bacterium RIFCSPLOWO2_12_FULL_62_27]|nr:MAG: hypothetical protein A3I06_13030 [Candidatus Lindowbacteria bacterium RIFCSPLOWO2_02_FULL_62_12]OGH61302.1 MAG: hypothetical protein A3G34_04710 [Candidatus Lindowbacteria bacterium RIFCSPLOWO2_12_FULL_62_27]
MFVSGMAVLVLEIVGAALIRPFIGVGLFVWSSMIAVTLAALAAGYLLGGRWTRDLTGPDELERRFFRAAFLAGASMIVLPWLTAPVLRAVESLDLRVASLVSAFLFTPSLILLGSLTPMAVALCVRAGSSAGPAAARLFAISTMGGFVSALASGLWLLAVASAPAVLQGTGILLMVAAFGSPGGIGRMRGPRMLGLSLSLAVLGASAYPAFHRRPEQVVHQRQTVGGKVQVVDRNAERWLLVDGAIQGRERIADGAPTFEYVTLIGGLPARLAASPANALMIGLGAGTLADRLASAGVRVTAVDIHAFMPEIASRYFKFDAVRSRVVLMDGRVYLRRASEDFDLVVFDAYNAYDLPDHLMTLETFRLVRRRLRPGGVFALNVVTLAEPYRLAPKDARASDAIGTTLRAAGFESVESLMVGTPGWVGNLIFLASDRPVAPCLTDRIQAIHSNPGEILRDGSRKMTYWEIDSATAWRNEAYAVFGIKILLGI